MAIGQISSNQSANVSMLTKNSAMTNLEKIKNRLEERRFDIREMEEEFTQEKEQVNETLPLKVPYSQTIEEIKQFATEMGEDLTDEDINYALRYGRSVLADYVA